MIDKRDDDGEQTEWDESDYLLIAIQCKPSSASM